MIWSLLLSCLLLVVQILQHPPPQCREWDKILKNDRCHTEIQTRRDGTPACCSSHAHRSQGCTWFALKRCPSARQPATLPALTLPDPRKCIRRGLQPWVESGGSRETSPEQSLVSALQPKPSAGQVPVRAATGTGKVMSHFQPEPPAAGEHRSGAAPQYSLAPTDAK